MNDLRVVELTRGKFAIVDKSDFANVSNRKWCFKPVRGDLSKGYAIFGFYKNGSHSTIGMHQFILGRQAPCVDHWNGFGIDNRRSNLRVTNLKNNGRNRGPTKGRALPKGVHIKRGHRRKKYFACIRVDDRLRHLGYFETVEDAARAYNAAATLFFKEFARLNAQEAT